MNQQTEDIIIKGKEILKTIVKSGGEAYFIGETALNILIYNDFNYAHIYATIDKDVLTDLFKEHKITAIENGIYELGYLGNKYYIHTTSSIQEKMHKTIEIQKSYSKLLQLKISQLDYTILSITMTHNNSVNDFFNGTEDIKKRKIRSIYLNVKNVYLQYPLKMLECIKLVSTTGYSLDKKIVKALNRCKNKLKSIDLETKSKLMYEIYKGKHFKKAIHYLYKTKMYKVLSEYKTQIKSLYNRFRNESENYFFGYEMIKRNEYISEIACATTNSYSLQMFVNLAITNPKSDFDLLTLFTYGLDRCLEANKINYLLGRSKKKYKNIKKAYNNLAIKKTCDLAFKGEDIIALDNTLTTDDIAIILDEVIENVLFNRLKNERSVLEKFIKEAINRYYGIDENSNQVKNQEIEKLEVEEEIEIKEEEKQEEVKDNTDLESKLQEVYDRTIELEFKLEIEKLINSSRVLENIDDSLKDSVRKKLEKSFIDALLKNDKYEKLRKIYGENNNE